MILPLLEKYNIPIPEKQDRTPVAPTTPEVTPTPTPEVTPVEKQLCVDYQEPSCASVDSFDKAIDELEDFIDILKEKRNELRSEKRLCQRTAPEQQRRRRQNLRLRLHLLLGGGERAQQGG